MMDHLMAEKLTKIIKTAKWGKSRQKKKKKFIRLYPVLLNVMGNLRSSKIGGAKELVVLLRLRANI